MLKEIELEKGGIDDGWL